MMDLMVTNLGVMVVSKAASVSWVTLFSCLVVGTQGQALYKLELNDKAGEGIYVASLQGDGYARDNTLLKYKGNVTNPLLSYTYCHRFQMAYTRPRMYISTYAYDDDESNELYSEYHLGRAAFR